MKYGKLVSAVLFASLLKVNAQDCDVVKDIIRPLFPIDEAADCCSYANNDQFVVKCNGSAVTSLSIVNAPALSEVPATLSSLNSLESIDFSNCNIAQFPYHLKTLPNLKSISLWKNGITEVTDEISEFKALEQLDLGDNKITALPATIGQLSNLNTLNVNNNNLQTLPDSLSQLANLKKLNVESNQNLNGSLKKFAGVVDQCNIKNTHVCIEEKGVCNNYTLNNKRMPYCHPENFTEEELNVDGASTSKSGSSSTAFIIIGILAVIIIAAIIGFIIAKNHSKNNSTDEVAMEKIENNVALEENKIETKVENAAENAVENAVENAAENAAENLENSVDNAIQETSSIMRERNSNVPSNISIEIKPLVGK